MWLLSSMRCVDFVFRCFSNSSTFICCLVFYPCRFNILSLFCTSTFFGFIIMGKVFYCQVYFYLDISFFRLRKFPVIFGKHFFYVLTWISSPSSIPISLKLFSFPDFLHILPLGVFRCNIFYNQGDHFFSVLPSIPEGLLSLVFCWWTLPVGVPKFFISSLYQFGFFFLSDSISFSCLE